MTRKYDKLVKDLFASDYSMIVEDVISNPNEIEKYSKLNDYGKMKYFADYVELIYDEDFVDNSDFEQVFGANYRMVQNNLIHDIIGLCVEKLNKDLKLKKI